MEKRLDYITDLMALGPTANARTIQRRQTAHRLAIAEAWQVKPGEKFWKSAVGKAT